MQGYKTLITGVLSIVGGAATAMGITLDAGAVSTIAENVDVVVGWRQRPAR